MKIYLKKVDGVTPPERGSTLAAGYDIVATSDPKIVGVKGSEEDGKKEFWRSIDYLEYETNLYIAPSALTFHTLIFPRSSISKLNLMLANSIGLVDNDYRGMVICRFKYVWQPTDFYQYKNALVGNINIDKIYKKGDKIAQLVFGETVQAEFELVDELQSTRRGEGGFGSTGTPSITEGSKNMVLTEKKRPEFPPNQLIEEPSLYGLVKKWFEKNKDSIPLANYEKAIKEAEKNRE